MCSLKRKHTFWCCSTYASSKVSWQLHFMVLGKNHLQNLHHLKMIFWRVPRRLQSAGYWMLLNWKRPHLKGNRRRQSFKNIKSYSITQHAKYNGFQEKQLEKMRRRWWNLLHSCHVLGGRSLHMSSRNALTHVVSFGIILDLWLAGPSKEMGNQSHVTFIPIAMAANQGRFLIKFGMRPQPETWEFR